MSWPCPLRPRNCQGFLHACSPGLYKNGSRSTFKVHSPLWGKHSLHPMLCRMAELHSVLGFFSSTTSLLWERFKASSLPQKYIFLSVLGWKQPFVSPQSYLHLCIQDLGCFPWERNTAKKWPLLEKHKVDVQPGGRCSFVCYFLACFAFLHLITSDCIISIISRCVISFLIDSVR